MKYRIRRTSQFKKDYMLSIKRGLAIDKLDAAIELTFALIPSPSYALSMMI